MTVQVIQRRGVLRTTGKRPLVCAPVHPNAGLQTSYQRKLDQFITAMHDAVLYWIKAGWRSEDKLDSSIAEDDAMTDALRRRIRNKGARWLKAFDDLAPALAKRLARSSQSQVDRIMAEELKKAGFTVDFSLSHDIRRSMNAIVAENVSLIKSIPQDYLAKVEQQVMRSVAAGRDLGTLTDALQEQYGVTRRRAALIARDQNNKATSAISHLRQKELGITQAKWRHSNGGNHPRPTHVAMNGKYYDIAKGMWDSAEGRYVFPGELINCKCVSVPVIEGSL